MCNLQRDNRVIKILIIDDEQVIRDSFSDQLEDLGYQVLQAQDGKEGISLALSEAPDLILTDLRMPIMSGIDVVKQCHLLLPSIPIIVISGVGLLDEAVSALRLGAFDYLTKPIRDLDILHTTVSRALDQARLKRENAAYQLHLEELVSERTQALSNAHSELLLHKNNLEQLVEERTQELEVVIENLTNTQNQLVESEKMASLGRLVAGVAHELNTPLGICITSVTAIQEKLARFELEFHQGTLKKSDFLRFLVSSQESNDVVFNNLNRASELVQNFKMVSVDVSSDMVRKFDLLEYLEHVVQSLQPEFRNTNISISIDGESNLIIEKHPGSLSQIITNLVMNSLLHAYSEGQNGKISINVVKDDGMIRLSYSDDGKGMESNVQERIFEPFFTTKRGAGGTGLGMNILYNLVTQNLDGVVICRSEVNIGSTFVIVFPVETE